MTPDLSESKHQMCRCSSDKSKRDGATRSWTSAATGRQARRGQPPRFIGRSAELETFEALLARPDHVSVLWLSGLGGVGKTALMQVCAGQARQAGWLTARVDGRTVAHSPRAFAGAVESAVTTDRSLPEVDGADATGLAIFIDTYERLESLDGWLREQYLPSLPAQTLIMIASRQLPSIEWRTDLYRLQPERFTVRHPDVTQALVRRLLDDVPTPLHRRALEVCAHLRVTTEDRLAEALMISDARELFDWLRSLSFIETGSSGVFPHDLTRDVIEADLRWRSPERFRQLHGDARRGIVRQLQHGSTAERQMAFSDLLFLHRNNPIMRPLFQWDTRGQAPATPAATQDHDLLVDIVRRHQGNASAEILRHWIRRQPDGFWMFHDAAGEVIGFVCMLEVASATDEDCQRDPAIAAARSYAAHVAPLRPGEQVLYSRWGLSRSAPVPSDTPGVWELICTVNVTQWFGAPRLSWSFVAVEDADRWTPFFSHIRQDRASLADFSVGGRTYAVFAHDWRAEPPLTWLREMSERELTTTPSDEDDLETQTPIVVLSHPEFAAAVRQALRDYARPDRLAGNALLSSRLVVNKDQDQSPTEALRHLVRLSAEDLNMHPRDQRLYRALYRTFFNPAATQEQAADLLGLPFSTYRSHLRAGTERVTELLWQRELYGAEGSASTLSTGKT